MLWFVLFWNLCGKKQTSLKNRKVGTDCHELKVNRNYFFAVIPSDRRNKSLSPYMATQAELKRLFLLYRVNHHM